MNFRLFIIPILTLVLSCQTTVVKSGYDFSTIQTISVAPIQDFKSFPGSGKIVSRSLIHHLMKIGVNVVEREKLGDVVKEAALSQTAIVGQDYDLRIGSPDAIIFCTITEFDDGDVIVIPITTHDKGRTVTTIEEKTEPTVVDSREGDEKEIIYQTTTTEETTHFKGTVTETSRIEYINSVVGITLQMVHKETGEVLWSSNYWYNALSLSNAVDRCVAGAVKPLKKILKNPMFQ